MHVDGAPVAHAYHRVSDPADPPRDLSGLAWGVFVTLGILAILALMRLATAVGLHSAAGNEGDVLGKYHAYSVWAGLSGLFLLVAAGVFIAWFFRAYKNLRRLGVQNMRYGNGWAIGAWFIPIFGMIRPKQIANDIWRGSERGVEVSTQWRQVEVPSLVHIWWALFLGQAIVVYVGQRLTQAGHNKLTSFGDLSSGLSQIKTGTSIDIVGELLAIAGVVVAIMVVSRVTARLDELTRETVAAGPAGFAAPPPPPVAPSIQPPPPAAPSYPPPAAPQAADYPPPQPTAYTPPPPQPAAYVPPPPPQPTGYAPPQPVAYPPPPQPADQRIQCPECAEWIQAQANVCRFCGHRLQPSVQ